MTQTYFLSECPYPELAKAVIRQAGGWEAFKARALDICRHGAQGGVRGFIACSETERFARRYQKLIVAALTDTADDFGDDVVNMVANFGYFRNNPADREDRFEIYRYVAGVKCRETTIPNLMAWFALEETARHYENAYENA